MYQHQDAHKRTHTSRACRPPNLTLALCAILFTAVVLRTQHAPALAATWSLDRSQAALTARNARPRSPLSTGPDLVRLILDRSTRYGGEGGRRSALLRIAQTMPIFSSVSPQSVVGGSGSLSVTITVDNTGGAIQVGTDHPSLLTSPSGTWPYQLSYPQGGSTSQTITVSTAQVSQSTSVKIYACPAGVDSSNPNNWTTVQTVTLTSH